MSSDNLLNGENGPVLKSIPKLLYPILEKRKHLPDEELYRYVLMLAVAIVAVAVHVLFSVFFAVVGCLPLAIGHVAGVVVFGVCYLLLQRRRYDTAGVLLSLMILFSCLDTVYLIGGDNYSVFYVIIVLMMQMTVPFERKAIPVTFALVLPVLAVGMYIFDLHWTPPYSIGDANHVLSVMNTIVATTGTITMLSLDRLVRQFVEQFKQLEMAELQKKAYLDPLTGLSNRRFADEYFTMLNGLKQDENLSMALVDIDDFKQINDTYGHDAGDKALCEIARIFSENTRKTDHAIRWGGEEFLLVIHASLENSYKVMEKIRMSVAKQKYTGEGYSFGMTITAGLAPLDPCRFSACLAECDRKLYEGKNAGKNRIVM